MECSKTLEEKKKKSWNLHLCSFALKCLEQLFSLQDRGDSYLFSRCIYPASQGERLKINCLKVESAVGRLSLPIFPSLSLFLWRWGWFRERVVLLVSQGSKGDSRYIYKTGSAPTGKAGDGAGGTARTPIFLAEVEASEGNLISNFRGQFFHLLFFFFHSAFEMRF